MALPPGITPKTVTVGIASFFDGSLAEGTATITAPVNVVHTPTNRPIFSSQMSHRFVDGETSFNLCPTDAPGLNRVDFSYKLSVVISGALVQPEPIYFLLPTAGPDEIDLDSLVTVPSSAGIPVSVTVVTSVNGQTGDVTVSGGGGTPADGTITPAKLSFDPATQAELDALSSSTTTGLANKVNTSTYTAGLAAKANTADLAAVAQSGSYNDLANKPTIPAAYTDAAAVAAVISSPELSAAYGPPGGTKRAALNLGSDLTQPSTSFTDVIQRTVLRLPVPSFRWRMRFRNLALTGPITGAISMKDIYVGAPLLGSGKWDGRFAAAPSKAIDAFTLPADGSEVITPWVTSAPLQFAADTNTALSFAFTCAGGQSVSFGGLAINHLRFGTGAAAQVGAAAPTGGSVGVGAFLDVRLEVEYVGFNRRLLVISDSTGAGITDDTNLASTLTGIEHAWPNRAAYLNRAICTNASVSGRTLFDFSSLSGVMWTRFDLSVATPDDAIIALGINDAVQAVSLASYQNFFGTLVGNLRTVGAKRIFATTVMPQPQFKPGALTAAAASGVTTLTTNWAFANGDVVDIDYGKSAFYEQRTVSGASVAVGDGTFTTTLTAATGKAHRAGAAITLVPESLRRSYNDWLRTVPFGLDGLFDIEPLLRDPAGPHVGSPDMTLWGTGVTHPGRAAYERIAYAVDVRQRG